MGRPQGSALTALAIAATMAGGAGPSGPFRGSRSSRPDVSDRPIGRYHRVGQSDEQRDRALAVAEVRRAAKRRRRLYEAACTREGDDASRYRWWYKATTGYPMPPYQKRSPRGGFNG